jgi:hypothetical protein
MSNEISRGKRIFAWGGVAFGIVVASLAGAILVLDGTMFPTLSMLAFALVLVIDRAMYLRGAFTVRNQLPTWNRIWFAANLLIMSSVTLNLFLQSTVYRTALLVEAGALVLTMVAVHLAILMSGTSWSGVTGPRRS